MVARREPRKEPGRRRLARGTEYVISDDKGHDYVSSGCALVDCVLGGGYVLGRMVNIVGDKSTGKTLLAIEAVINFLNTYPDGHVRYAEVEAAFDKEYAASLGMPVDRVDFATEMNTVEDWYVDVERMIDTLKGEAGLYIIDSLDALSDKAEIERKIDDGSFGAAKAKKISESFRKFVRKLESSRCLLIVISQIRDNIGVMFGAKHTRSGGHALDFYASQIIWLHEAGKIDRTVQGVKRVIGLEVRARCTKNKVGLPWREAKFRILFGYGIDDLSANAEWLDQLKRPDLLTSLGFTGRSVSTWIGKVRDGASDVSAAYLRPRLAKTVIDTWREIEREFIPPASKY
jgi:recombination protein RecA